MDTCALPGLQECMPQLFSVKREREKRESKNTNDTTKSDSDIVSSIWWGNLLLLVEIFSKKHVCLAAAAPHDAPECVSPAALGRPEVITTGEDLRRGCTRAEPLSRNLRRRKEKKRKDTKKKHDQTD